MRSWQPPNLVQPHISAFTGHTGCKVNTANFLLIDHIHLFLDVDFYEEIVHQTNMRAEQFLREQGGTLGPHSRAHRWTHISLGELKKYLGLTVNMGIVHKPSIHSY